MDLLHRKITCQSGKTWKFETLFKILFNPRYIALGNFLICAVAVSGGHPGSLRALRASLSLDGVDWLRPLRSLGKGDDVNWRRKKKAEKKREKKRKREDAINVTGKRQGSIFLLGTSRSPLLWKRNTRAVGNICTQGVHSARFSFFVCIQWYR